MHARHRKILEMLQTDRLYIRSAAAELGVSEMTLRRDLRELEEQKLVMMVKGGAIMHPARYEPEKSPMMLTPEKFALAEALYDEIMPAEKLFIGSGFTALAFAKLLARRRSGRLTVITNSLSAAASLFRANHKVILLGGELRSNSLELVGPLTERNLSDFDMDWMVVGCDSASAKSGFRTWDINLARVKQRLLGCAGHAAVITESSKFYREGAEEEFTFAAPYQIDLLVTDTGLDPAAAAELRNSGMQVVTKSIPSIHTWN